MGLEPVEIKSSFFPFLFLRDDALVYVMYVKNKISVAVKNAVIRNKT
jgi:hypothetical protein